jgi:uncharacterized membrane protein
MTTAYGINSLGQVCGFTGNKAKVWDPGGTVTDIGPIENCTWAYARGINDAGRIVGYGSESGWCRAFTWSPSGGLTMLPVISSSWSIARGINNRGQITGYVDEPGRTTGVVWEADLSIRRLSVKPEQTLSGGKDINDEGCVVGYASSNGSSNGDPAMWTPDNVQVLLPILSGCDFGGALGINCKNQIVGYCASRSTGEAFPVLWEPVAEPSALLALTGALAGLGGLARRRGR